MHKLEITDCLDEDYGTYIVFDEIPLEEISKIIVTFDKFCTTAVKFTISHRN